MRHLFTERTQFPTTTAVVANAAIYDALACDDGVMDLTSAGSTSWTWRSLISWPRKQTKSKILSEARITLPSFTLDSVPKLRTSSRLTIVQSGSRKRKRSKTEGRGWAVKDHRQSRNHSSRRSSSAAAVSSLQQVHAHFLRLCGKKIYSNAACVRRGTTQRGEPSKEK